jgi:2,3-bisphosphoglycerate-dependent phosphoglycerate mutase
MAAAVPPLTTWLIRHGQSTANAGLPTSSQSEAPLTDLGREQARALADRVSRRPDLLIVSPYLRTRATAEPIRARWPALRCETWPIQELTYLSPALCENTTVETRRPMVDAYWQRCDPDFVHGPGAESFADFLQRIRAFHDRLLGLTDDFAVVIGHGQFFRALAFGVARDFAATPERMRDHRAAETTNPMANGEIATFGADGVQTLRA